MNIPNQLVSGSFIPIAYGTKACKITEWEQPKNQIDYNQLSSIDKINYGVVARTSNLCIIDIDQPCDERCKEVITTLPDTFTVETGKGLHLYYNRPEDIPFEENTISLKDIPSGSLDGKVHEIIGIRYGNCYVIGPGSKHEDGKYYKVLKDLPIVDISVEQLNYIISLFKVETPDNTLTQSTVNKVEDEKGKEHILIKTENVDKKDYGYIFNYDINKVLSFFNISSATTIHPIHGSDTGQNWSVENNLCRCWRCNKSFGPLDLFALLTTRCDCKGVENYTKGKNFDIIRERFETTFPDCKNSKSVEEMKPIYYGDLEVYQEDESGYILENGLLTVGSEIMFAADTGTGKSVLGYQMSHCLSQGIQCLDFIPYRNEPKKILILENEDIIDTLKQMKEGFKTQFPFDPKYGKNVIIYQDLLTDFFNDLYNLLKLHQPNIVMINPFGSYYEDELNKDAVRSWFNHLHEVDRLNKVGAIIFHHLNKGKRFHGSQYIKNCPRVFFEIHDKNETSGEKSNGIYRFDVGKGERFFGKPFTYYAHSTDGQMYWTYSDGKNPPMNPGLKYIFDYVENNPEIQRQDLIKWCMTQSGKGETTVKNQIRMLVQIDKLIQSDTLNQNYRNVTTYTAQKPKTKLEELTGKQRGIRN